MLLNRRDAAWGWFTLLASAAAVLLYVGVFHPAAVPWLRLPDALVQPHRQHRSVGNSPLGLAYGVIAYAIFIFAVLLNVRRKFPQVRVGRAQTWLRAHIWLTILTLPLVFMHAAFRFGSLMTTGLMWLYLLVMLSGFYGLALQQFLPRLMKDRLTRETIYEQIPFLTRRLRASALSLRDELRTVPPVLAAQPSGITLAAPAENDPSVPILLDALEREVLPFLHTKNPRHAPLTDRLFAEEFFRALRLRVAPDNRPQADLLAAWCEEHRQMQMQAHYHRWMHGWLLVHVPASFLLIILTGWHAVATLVLY